MATEEEIKARIREIMISSIDTPIPSDVFDGRLQQAFELRDFVRNNLSERLRKEALMAGGLYEPSLRERFQWAVEDKINGLRSRISRRHL